MATNVLSMAFPASPIYQRQQLASLTTSGIEPESTDIARALMAEARTPVQREWAYYWNHYRYIHKGRYNIPAFKQWVESYKESYLVPEQLAIVTARACYNQKPEEASEACDAAACKECTPDLCPKPAPPAAKPAPAPKPEAKPAPKPEAKPAAKPKPEFENVELKIELQGIAFNKVEMTADNKKELDEFLAKEVKPLATVGAMIITGHTDRIGSEKYNKKLSEKRARGVKDYVVGKGIDQKLIFWEGKGPKQPIPVTKFCENKMKRKQLIECLAPNRRVTVEVVGTILPPPPKPKPEAKP
jgi:outer membrane protein OmpA-like peptidoglycan-associated protein